MTTRRIPPQTESSPPRPRTSPPGSRTQPPGESNALSAHFRSLLPVFQPSVARICFRSSRQITPTKRVDYTIPAGQTQRHSRRIAQTKHWVVANQVLDCAKGSIGWYQTKHWFTANQALVEHIPMLGWAIPNAWFAKFSGGSCLIVGLMQCNSRAEAVHFSG